MEKTLSNSSGNKREGILMTDSSAKNSPRKRVKCVKQKDPFDLLTDDAALFPIFEFIGSYHFRFIAGVSRRWRYLYTQFQREEYRKRVQNKQDFEKLISTSITSTASIAESVSRAKVFLDDARTYTSPLFDTIEMQKNGFQQMKHIYTPRSSVIFLSDNVAVRYGQLEILQLAIANGYTCDVTTCYGAAEKGQLEVLQWLRTKGCPWDECVCSFAAANGHLDVLKWARENSCPWDENTWTYAVANGHLNVLRWAIENDCPWDVDTCAEAARNGQLGVLQWVRESGCPWDERTCTFAAKNGHLGVLQWARENGCPWDELTCTCAAEDGHLDVLQWARDNGCPWDESTCVEAAKGGHLDVLKWALENGCEWNRHLSAGESWPQSVIGWLQENNELDA